MEIKMLPKKVRGRRSEPLSKHELKTLKQYRKGFSSDTACALSLGLDRNVFIRAIVFSSGHPTTIEKIRAVLKTGINEE